MWKVLAIVCVLGLVAAEGEGQQERRYRRRLCFKRAALFGRTLRCPPGHVAVSLCTSGEDKAECEIFNGKWKASTVITCCRAFNHKIAKFACDQHKEIYGKSVNCGENKVLFSFSAAGEEKTRMECCDGLRTRLTDKCEWKYGNYGEAVKCKRAAVIAGVCSSKTQEDCNGHNTGARCCEVRRRQKKTEPESTE